MQQSPVIILLKQKVDEFFSRYSHIPSKQKIYAKFDRTLFSQDFESLSFYLKEVRQCLTQLEKINDDNVQKYTFYSEKLKGQCKALSEALSQTNAKTNIKFQHNDTNLQSVQERREKQRIALNKLPPRERLSKYYEALQALNTKLERQRDCFEEATLLQDKQTYSQQIAITQQRKQRCSEAIEQLEEYLALLDTTSEK
ncbi:primosomal replication protein PriC [Histophilus somni]|uniref:Primosomal replication protein N n=1 Tax=Histophilus somni TaxID=731 RepID=A0A6F8NYA3_HISSO|nr:primosomal replication protein [Histophilus somni]ACA31243.1 conserved hypothetical protein [Histophilus somni 2336]QQF85286.1 primosomal replication protein [Histophilus somni]QQJ90897.1 primosomal replication protein [Histophilus somni]BBD20571.1 hypothetical protein [Histophilus somni]